MSPASERRKSERFEHRAPIVFAPLGSDEFIDAKLCNFCSSGMGFATAAPVPPGTEIYIMTEHYLPDDIGAEIYDGFLGSVRWCEPGSDSQESVYFVGVQYSTTTIKWFRP